MEIALAPSTARIIREALGDDVDLAPGAVPAALSRLAVESPPVYSRVLAELSGTQIRLDSERALARDRRRGRLRRLLFWWGEYESDVGDRLIAKRHVAAAVPLGLAGLIVLLLGVSALVGRPHPRAAVVHASRPPAAAARVAPPGSAARTLPLVPAGPRPSAPARAVAAALTAGPMPPVPSPLPPDPAAPDGAQPAPPLRIAPDASAPGNPLVFNAQPTLAASPATRGAQGSAPPPPVVYDARAGAAGPSSGTAAAGPVRWTIGQRVGARLVTGIVAVAGGAPVPVIARSTDGGATWMGRAALDPDGRVRAVFVLAGAEGGHAGRGAPAGPGGGAAPPVVRGVALDPVTLVPGLSGPTALRRPQAVAATLSAAVQAAADYARALAQQGQVTLVNGWAQLATGQAGPAWTYLAARLADGIAPRAAAPGPVATTEIAAGTPLAILITEAP